MTLSITLPVIPLNTYTLMLNVAMLSIAASGRIRLAVAAVQLFGQRSIKQASLVRHLYKVSG